MDKNKVLLDLFDAWEKREKSESDYYTDLPSEIQDIEDQRLKRVYILFYYVLSGKLSIKQSMFKIKKLIQLRAKSTEELPASNWTCSEEGVINPVEIARATSIEIRACLKNRISIKDAISIKNLGMYIIKYNEIPNTTNSLLRFAIINNLRASMIMYHAWNRVDEIVLTAPMCRAIYRLGWLKNLNAPNLNMIHEWSKKKNVNSLKMQQSIENMFPFSLWGKVPPAFDHHGTVICKRIPLCDKCILKDTCPSSRVPKKVNTYMGTLQKQGYFLEHKADNCKFNEEKDEKEEKELLSYEDTEEEDMSDI
ncbi:hypothetical protein NEPAR04_0291 [Nematocida parisii]|nr:hypothetical protein NEPAR08_0285 [Nematocida parisii]KAI5126214.1 hypothetical protein NEPAR03_0386 [Nematocida parisii]KAI5140459.1 hypothetical protein NEPAR04_0291 [Nematocida parisii]